MRACRPYTSMRASLLTRERKLHQVSSFKIFRRLLRSLKRAVFSCSLRGVRTDPLQNAWDQFGLQKMHAKRGFGSRYFFATRGKRPAQGLTEINGGSS